MPYVIAEPCMGAQDKACVEVCPVDAIHGLAESPQMYINSLECVCCAACVPECPVDAIFDSLDLPDKWKHYEQINADFYKK